jgi:DNA-binding transcriptional ArsR family regulator
MRPHAAKAAQFLKVLSNEQRLMILCTLIAGPLSVGQLNQRVPLSHSALSQHLGILRDSGIVATARESQSVVYSLPPGIATHIIGLLHQEFCSH